MHLVTKAMMLTFSAIHLLPLAGVLGGAHLERLYGITVTDPNLIIMMRHRAILFALLAIFVGCSAFRADLTWLGVAAGLISAGAFVALAWSVGGYNPKTARVVTADLIAVACLVVAAISHFISSR